MRLSTRVHQISLAIIKCQVSPGLSRLLLFATSTATSRSRHQQPSIKLRKPQTQVLYLSQTQTNSPNRNLTKCTPTLSPLLSSFSIWSSHHSPSPEASPTAASSFALPLKASSLPAATPAMVVVLDGVKLIWVNGKSSCDFTSALHNRGSQSTDHSGVQVYVTNSRQFIALPMTMETWFGVSGVLPLVPATA